MRRSRLIGVLVLLATAASLLAAACSTDATSTPVYAPAPPPRSTIISSTPDVSPILRSRGGQALTLIHEEFAADSPISTTAALTGFLPGERIEVTLSASDGSSVSLGIATANVVGLASLDFRVDGLSADTYALMAIGDEGNKASGALFIK